MVRSRSELERSVQCAFRSHGDAVLRPVVDRNSLDHELTAFAEVCAKTPATSASAAAFFALAGCAQRRVPFRVRSV
jgi:hypothetical protein